MRRRTLRFALDAIRFCEALPSGEVSRVISRQLVRSATSVGANYRSAQRGRSRGEFRAKLGIVIEEADECAYWLELLDELDRGNPAERARMRREADELVAIMFAARRAAQSPARTSR
jgi:four helix bundle protein